MTIDCTKGRKARYILAINWCNLTDDYYYYSNYKDGKRAFDNALLDYSDKIGISITLENLITDERKSFYKCYRDGKHIIKERG